MENVLLAGLQLAEFGSKSNKEKENMKKFFIILLVFAVLGGGILWYYRYDIFQYSAETIIMQKLPKYVHVDRIIFDLQNKSLQVRGFGIKNPRGYEDKYLATIETITAKYKMKGANILDGIVVTSIEGVRPIINIERQSNGKLNVEEMGSVMEASDQKSEIKETVSKSKVAKIIGGRKDIAGKTISDLVELPDTINVTSGRIIFLDKVISPRGYRLSFDDFNGDIKLQLNENYTQVIQASTNGRGFVNGDKSQSIDWVVATYPQSEQLHMSNRFEINNVDAIAFKPYFAKYSPVDITKAWISGTLVFNFSDGDIGSSNVLRISGLEFVEPRSSEGSGLWDVSVSDIIEYLRNSTGEVVFDFKIKGSMESPRFMLGPHVKQAVQSMAIDAVSKLLSPQGAAQKGTQAVGAAKSETEQVVNVIRQLLEKQ